MLFILFLAVSSCSILPQRDGYTYKSALSINSKNVALSKSKIDSSSTRELFFHLDKSEVVIQVTLSLSGTNLLGESIPEIPFFVVEKVFTLNDQTEYCRLGENFDTNYTLRDPILIVNDNTSDPLCRLTPGTYRIRFTFFDEKEFEGKCIIESQRSKAHIQFTPEFSELASSE
jgi:hypothetical protein